MTNEMALWLAIGSGVMAVLYGLFSSQWILRQPAGNERMQKIALAIQEGAGAYMNRQYFTIGVVGAVLFLVLGFGVGYEAGPEVMAEVGFGNQETTLADAGDEFFASGDAI